MNLPSKDSVLLIMAGCDQAGAIGDKHGDIDDPTPTNTFKRIFEDTQVDLNGGKIGSAQISLCRSDVTYTSLA